MAAIVDIGAYSTTKDLWGAILQKVNPEITNVQQYICNYPAIANSLAYNTIRQIDPTFTKSNIITEVCRSTYQDLCFNLAFKFNEATGGTSNPTAFLGQIQGLFNNRASDYIYHLITLYDNTVTTPADVPNVYKKSRHMDLLHYLWSVATPVFGALLTGAGSLIADIIVTHKLAATITGAGTMQAQMGILRQLATEQEGTGTLSANFNITQLLAATPTGSGTLVADMITFGPTYQDVLDEATNLGYVCPTDPQKDLQNDLIKTLQDNEVWAKLDVFYMFATDGDSDFATLNWIDPTAHQITKVSSPGFTTNQGFNSDGSTSYLNTNYIPGSGNYSLNDACFGFWESTAVSGYWAGQNNGSDLSFYRQVSSLQAAINSGSSSLGPNTTLEHVHVNRPSSAQLQLYLDGATYSLQALSSTAIAAFPFFLLALNGSGTPYNFLNSAGKMGCFYAGQSLTSDNISDLYDALNTYFNAI